MINRKEKGSRRERQAKKELEAQGYLVTKSGGSLGDFDLIAIPTIKDWDFPLLKLIQIKSNYISPKERSKIKSIRLPIGVEIRKEIWIYKDRKGKTIEIV